MHTPSPPHARVQDEVFHVPQTQQYCRGNYEAWDPKITTLPGTYALVAAVARVVHPLGWVRVFSHAMCPVKLEIRLACTARWCRTARCGTRMALIHRIACSLPSACVCTQVDACTSAV